MSSRVAALASRNAAFGVILCCSACSHHRWPFGECWTFMDLSHGLDVKSSLPSDSEGSLWRSHSRLSWRQHGLLKSTVGFRHRENQAYISILMFSVWIILASFLMATESLCPHHSNKFLWEMEWHKQSSQPVIITNKWWFTFSSSLPTQFWPFSSYKESNSQ